MAASAGQLTTVMARGCDQGGARLRADQSRLEIEGLRLIHPWRASSQSVRPPNLAIKTLRLEPAGMDLGDRDGHDEPSVGDSDIFVGIYWQSLGGSLISSGTTRPGSGLPGLVYVKELAADREHGLTDLLDRIAPRHDPPSGPSSLLESLQR